MTPPACAPSPSLAAYLDRYTERIAADCQYGYEEDGRAAQADVSHLFPGNELGIPRRRHARTGHAPALRTARPLTPHITAGCAHYDTR